MFRLTGGPMAQKNDGLLIARSKKRHLDPAAHGQAGRRPAEPAARAKQLGLDSFSFEGCPTVFWDVFGQQGHPVRTTISDMGPLLLSRILNLNDVQSGVLTVKYESRAAEIEVKGK
jgi:DNA helicase HerA-like ATPase